MWDAPEVSLHLSNMRFASDEERGVEVDFVPRTTRSESLTEEESRGEGESESVVCEAESKPELPDKEGRDKV